MSCARDKSMTRGRNVNRLPDVTAIEAGGGVLLCAHASISEGRVTPPLQMSNLSDDRLEPDLLLAHVK